MWRGTTVAIIPFVAKILIVEDDARFALLEMAVLQKAGWKAYLAPSVEECLRTDLASFDAVVLGARLPAAAGMSIVSQIRRRADAPVVVLAGENVAECTVDALKAGAFSCLAKDSRSLEILPHVIRQALGGREAERSRELLRRAERLAILGTLAEAAARELKTPLAVILAYAEMIGNDDVVDARTAAERITAAAERSSHIMRSLDAMALDYRPSTEACSLCEIVVRALACSFDDARWTATDDELELPPTELLVEADRLALQEALHQIMRNALEAMGGSGVLRVGWRASDEAVNVWVEDTGLGVPEEIEEKIFEPFFGTGEGAGMGLAVARTIVRGHGGKLWHERPPGGGARLCLTMLF